MNTNKTGMRTALAAAAAGALILGSTGGAIADPVKAKGPKSVVQLQSVNIHGHSLVNFFDVSETESNSVRDIKFRATVRDKKDVVGNASSVLVTVGLFDKKVDGSPVAVDGLTFDELTLALTKEKKRSKRYSATMSLSPTQSAPIKGYLAQAMTKTYLCIADADLDWTGDVTNSKQVRKRLGKGDRKPVRDCVKLVDVDPSLTKTESDD